MKKLLIYAAILCTCVLSACGTGNPKTPPEPAESHPVAVAEIYELELPVPMDQIDCHAISDTWLYLATRSWDDESKTVGCRIFQNDIHRGYGPDKRIWEPDALPRTLVAGQNGECYLFGQYKDQTGFYLNTYDKEGALLRHREYSPQEMDNMGEKLSGGLVTADGCLYLYTYGSGGTVFSFDPEGNPAEIYTPPLESLEGVVAGSGNRVYAYYVTGEEPLFAELGAQGEPLSCPIRPNRVFGGYDQGIYLSTGDGLWQYIPETGETCLLWEWDEDYIQLDGNELDQIFYGRDGLYLLLYDQTERASKMKESLTIARVTFQDSRDYPEKQTVTLGTVYDYNLNTHVEELVRLYNRQSRDYRVELISYEKPENSSRSDLLGELQLRLIRGEGPDLMELTGMYADSLIAQGVFEDLDSYYRTSDRIRNDELLSCVRESGSVMGHNVLVIPSFYIYSTISKQEIAPQDWTPWHYLDLASREQLTQFPSRGSSLSLCLGIKYGEHFIDYKKKECHFDSEEFISLLEQCALLESVECPLSYSQPSLREADFMMKVYDLNSSEDYLTAEHENGKIYWVGRPGWEGMENEMYPDEVFAMNSTSSNKEGAWDFLEFLLSQELQEKIDWGFPSREDCFEQYLRSSYMAEDYHAEDFFSTFSKHNSREMTEEDFAIIRNIVDTAVFQSWGSTNPIISIVSEESSMYFSGDATVEETVEKIQSRVNLYLSEL